jgi:uncharacterized protein YecT (DUF1311 family)
MLLTSSFARSASFDCAKAKTPQEKAICSSPELSAADDRMAAAYHKALAAVPPDMREATRAGQRAWLRAVAIKCEAGDPTKAKRLPECMLQYYPNRAHLLDHMVFRMGGIAFFEHSTAKTAPAADDPENLMPQPTLWISIWPQALSSAPEWRAWNLVIEKAVEEVAQSEDPGQDSYFEITVASVTPWLVSASASTYWYGHGAAHGDENLKHLNWLLKENREVKAGDVFRPHTGWEHFLAAQCDKAARAQLGYMYADDLPPGEIPKKMFGIVSDPHSWQIDSKGITIAFVPDEIGCHACTPNPITIPWNAVKPFLTTEFAVFAK